MARQDVPGSVRVRTDDGNEWRYDAIHDAANYYDCNRSDAVAYACADVTGAVDFLEAVLEREDFTVAQRQELAELANHYLRGVTIDIVDDVSIIVTP